MKTKTLLILAFTFVCLTFSTGFCQQTADQLYQEGLYHEDVHGNLENAIKIYEKILKDFSNNRSIAAKAQLHIGMCKEKLGLQEAIEEYENVIKKYPEQQNEVALAKENVARLAAMVEKKKEKEIEARPNFRKIKIPDNPEHGILTPDGKKLIFTSDGCLWYVPIPGNVSPDIAGEPVKMTDNINAWDYANVSLSISADGKWIAYNSITKRDNAIHIIPISGGKPKTVTKRLSMGGPPYKYRPSLSPNGKTLTYTEIDGENNHINTISIKDSVIKRLSDSDGRQPVFSPDGKKIAYIRRYTSKDNQRLYNIVIITACGNNPINLHYPKMRPRSPIWSPDSKMIAFIAELDDSNLSKELWIVTLKEGSASQTPIKIELPYDNSHMLSGWTTEDKIGIFLINPEKKGIYSISLDGGKAVQITPDLNWIYELDWGPDENIIFFQAGNLYSVPGNGGTIHQFYKRDDFQVGQGTPGGNNEVSPDNKQIVFSGYSMEKKPEGVHIWLMPYEGGKPMNITKSPTQDRFPCWSPDGKSIAFLRYHEKQNNEIVYNIYTVPARGGKAEKLTTELDKVAFGYIDWSPDGKYIAFVSTDNQLKILNLKDGSVNKLVYIPSITRYSEIHWSPKGHKIAYTTSSNIWTVSLENKKPEKVVTGLGPGTRYDKISWSPNGKRLGFIASEGGDSEFWLMEDFLPLVENQK